MSNELMTSLDEIAKHEPCRDVWYKLLELLGHDLCLPEDFKGDDTLFKVSEIGKLGNVEWLFWTATLFENDSETLNIYRWFSLWCAERVRHFMADERSRNALDVCRDYLEGNASKEQLLEAKTAADDAVFNHSATYSHSLSSSSCCFLSAPSRSLVYAYAYTYAHSYSSALSAYHAVLSASNPCSFLSAPSLSVASPTYDKDNTEQLSKLMEALDAGSHMSLTKESVIPEEETNNVQPHI